MKKLGLLIIILTINLGSLMAQELTITKKDANPNGLTEFRGDFVEGTIIEDLSWAANSAVACFPGTQNTKFRGNHVLYQFDKPKYAELTVTLIPDDPNQNVSLYGYQVGLGKAVLPTQLSSCVSCEADHKWDYPKKGKTQDHTRSVFFNSTTNPYTIVIGATGPEEVREGGFTIRIEMKSRVEAGPQGDLKIFSANAEKGKTLAYAGDLSQGTTINDLSWAANSSVACFPATQNTKFRGNHVFFVTEIPDHSVMTIKLIPNDPNTNMSLYAYQDGVGSNVYPPNLQRCVSCEADHKWDYPKRGQTQDHTRSVKLNAIQNPYRVVIGVAGAEGVTAGDFTVQITVE